MDKHKCMKNCMSLLTTKYFEQVDSGPKKHRIKSPEIAYKLKSNIPYIKTRNYIPRVHVQESLMEPPSYKNYRLK